MADSEKTGGFRAEVSLGDSGSTALVRAYGEIDMATAEQFRGAVAEAFELDADTVLVELGGVPLLTSSGLSVLAESHEQALAARRNLVVRTAGAPRIVHQAITAVGLDQVLTIRAEDDAE
ncbi:STAS domain-containing protein [Saccharopolyspora sp. MS10]|uniref:STAS domain-containing protein n=1 Tax=Saccharopolyspora sp. MS10 TaxID=3385973 RepID=UPI0039A1862C